MLQEENKQHVMQSIVLDGVFGKRKILYDQIREGLKITGVLEILSNNPEMMGYFFLYGHQITIDNFSFDDSSVELIPFFKKFIDVESEDTVLKVCYYISGRRGVSATSKLHVECEHSDAYNASTCDEGITIPSGVKGNYELFSVCLKGVMEGRTFNVI